MCPAAGLSPSKKIFHDLQFHSTSSMKLFNIQRKGQLLQGVLEKYIRSYKKPKMKKNQNKQIWKNPQLIMTTTCKKAQEEEIQRSHQQGYAVILEILQTNQQLEAIKAATGQLEDQSNNL
ncbi:hypothetical protein Droror1_Dr00027642 [Drosera rotundifolia]